MGFNFLHGGNDMPVTEYLERARECAALADRSNNVQDKKRLLESAEAWADLAKAAAKKAAAVAPSRSSQHDGDAR
jgi:hypothetical protein